MAYGLNRPSHDLYTASLGIPHFFPRISDGVYGPGVSFDDVENFTVTLELERRGRDSKAYDIPTTVRDDISKRKFTVSMTVMKHLPIVRAASMLGEVGVKIQAAQVGLTQALGSVVSGGVYDLTHYGIANVTVTSDGVDLDAGVDFMVDRGSGMVEFTDDFDVVVVTYDTVAISGAFITQLGSSSGLRGKIVFRPTNGDGVREYFVLHDVTLSPEGARALVSAGTEFEGITLTGIAAPGPDGSPGFETDLPFDD